MPIITISEAAKLFNVPRTTLYRKIKNGDISAQQGHDGKSGVDVSEMVRVFGEPFGKKQWNTTDSAMVQTTDSLAQAVVQALKDQISHLEATIAEYQIGRLATPFFQPQNENR